MCLNRTTQRIAALTVLLALTASLQGDEPRDNWESERVASAVESHFREWAKRIVSDEPLTETQIANLRAASDFSANVPNSSSKQMTFHDDRMRVFRLEGPGRTYRGVRECIEAIRDSIGGSNRRFDFKVVRISLDGIHVRTVIYTSLIARTRNQLVEQTGDWEVTWVREPLRDGLTMNSIRVDSYERADWMNDHGRPMFADLTGSLFDGVVSFREQLAHGQAHWQRRIEGCHGIVNPAQNGLALGDVNGDGLDDVYVCQPGGLPNRLFLHQPDGTVRDVSAASGCDFLDETHAALIIDFDNDGDQDLVLSTFSALLLLENDGTSRFTVKAAFDSIRDAYSLAAADFDHDGDLDVYTCGYFPDGADVQALPVPVPYFDATNGGPNHLLLNEGQWRVTDVTRDVGLNVGNDRFSYAAIWIDLDNDTDQDLFVANDFGRINLYRNDLVNGKRHFKDVGPAVGLGAGAFGMSASAADVDRDGFDDVYVANMFSSAGNRVARQPQFRPTDSIEHRAKFAHLASGNSLFMNRRGRSFSDVAVPAGVAMGRWGWGANFIDINNDGWDDVLASNGYISGEIPEDL
jgi:hypothetical protein